MDKIFLARNAIIKSKFGGYGRVVEDGALGQCVYIKKYTTFTVISFNLYTQTVLLVNSETKDTVSVEYKYILENCDIVKQPKNVLLDGIAIVDLNDGKEKTLDYSRLAFYATIVVEFTIILAALISL